MATEYEGIDEIALVELFRRIDCEGQVACHDLDTIQRAQISAVLARLQADGRLITGEVTMQYGRRDRDDGIVVGPFVYETRDTEFFEPVFRYVSGWLPVSDIGNDDQGQEKT